MGDHCTVVAGCACHLSTFTLRNGWAAAKPYITPGRMCCSTIEYYLDDHVPKQRKHEQPNISPDNIEKLPTIYFDTECGYNRISPPNYAGWSRHVCKRQYVGKESILRAIRLRIYEPRPWTRRGTRHFSNDLFGV